MHCACIHQGFNESVALMFVCSAHPAGNGRFQRAKKAKTAVASAAPVSKAVCGKLATDPKQGWARLLMPDLEKLAGAIETSGMSCCCPIQ